MAAPSSKAVVVGKNLGTSGKVFFGSLCVGTFGLGCWQLERLLGKWDAIEDREEQLKLSPIRYGRRIPSNNTTATTNMNQLVGDEQLSSNSQTPLQQQQPYRRRLLRGTFRHDKEVLIGPRGAPPGVRMPVSGLSARNSSKTTTASGMQPGPQGFYILTPLELVPLDDEHERTSASITSMTSTSPSTSTSSVVWINRGWVPKTLVPGADRPHYKNDLVQKAKIDQALREQPAAWNRPLGTIEIKAILSQAESEWQQLQYYYIEQ